MRSKKGRKKERKKQRNKERKKQTQKERNKETKKERKKSTKRAQEANGSSSRLRGMPGTLTGAAGAVDDDGCKCNDARITI
jgi:hypothetical protein